MALINKYKIKTRYIAPRQGLFRTTNLNWRCWVREIMLPLNYPDVGDSRLLEGLYRLLDEVEARHQEGDSGARSRSILFEG